MRAIRRALIVALAAAAGPAAGQDDGAATDELEVTEIVLSKALDSGRPVDPGTSFRRSDGRIYATIRVSNPRREETSIRVAWESAEGPASSGGIELDIPPRIRYRTVARTGTRRPAGRYRCVVYSADDTELGRVEFELVE